ncbi:OmpA family protein [Octadecabacter sp. CECT 8868]|uniref:OmpA family protein n=1 Tax=Octadecabacter algicola TaxID=2909342 RepID=UPI001F439A32|nr:OmpA family protein [Octadecabacter algicola]MCF2903656.1 OmpA family protein [Octadecabacter algicola]
MDRIELGFSNQDVDVYGEADAPFVTTEQEDDAIAALAAVTAATTLSPVEELENVSDTLAAMLVEADTADDVQATRSQGIDLSAVQEVEIQATPVAAPTTPVTTGFFTAAKENLAQATSCANDLRNLASQSRVYFPSGALSGESAGLAQARLIGTIAQRCPGVTIQVEGHSDPSGDSVVNLRLSQERAEAVITRVAAAGIDTSKMVAIGMGDGFPSGVTGAEDAAYYDRRVEFRIIDTLETAFGAQPVPNAGIVTARVTECVTNLQKAAQDTSIIYAPGSAIVSTDAMGAAFVLAEMAMDCPEARLRVIGQHADEYGGVEDAATARLRAIALISSMDSAGFETSEIIMVAPSGPTPVEGLSNARVDFDVILEEL